MGKHSTELFKPVFFIYLLFFLQFVELEFKPLPVLQEPLVRFLSKCVGRHRSEGQAHFREPLGPAEPPFGQGICWFLVTQRMKNDQEFEIVAEFSLYSKKFWAHF